MIRAEDAIASARAMLGTPYSEVDCIRMIVLAIRNSPGGVTDYRCEGTNWLWNSVNNSGKYRHLTNRQEGIAGARAGMIAFKRSGSDVHHAGIVTGRGTVVHSSSTQGGRGVVETQLSTAEGWNLLGTHRYIQVSDGQEDESGGVDMPVSYSAQIRLENESSSLNVRSAPGGSAIGRLNHGAVIQVTAEEGEWAQIGYNGGNGYVSMRYLEPISSGQDAPPESGGNEAERITVADSAGNRFEPEGDFQVLIGSVD